MKNVNKVTNKITHSHTNTKLERERERDDDESLMQIDLCACDFVPFFFFVLIHTILIHTHIFFVSLISAFHHFFCVTTLCTGYTQNFYNMEIHLFFFYMFLHTKILSLHVVFLIRIVFKIIKIAFVDWLECFEFFNKCEKLA